MEEVEHFSHPGHKLTTTNNKDPTNEEEEEEEEEPMGKVEHFSHPRDKLTTTTTKDPTANIELAPRIKVTFHGKHRTLQLKEYGSWKCGICWERMRGLGYSCHKKSCKYGVHIECVNSAPCILNKGRRDHEFVRLPVSASYKSMSYTCEACGLDCDDADFHRDPRYVSDVPYMCKLCHIFVHEECLKLPPTVRIRYHPRHWITHTYWLGEQEQEEEGLVSDSDDEGSAEDKDEDEDEDEDEDDDKEEDEDEETDDDEEEEQIDKLCCGVCDARMNFDHGGYRCGDCGFVCHSKCIKEFIINDDEESKEEWDDLKKPSFVVIRESLVEEGQEKKVVIEEMKHFSHHHNLILLQDINEQSRDRTNTRCECCALLIQPCFSSMPSCYGCPVPGCDFYMHTSCATLPRRIRLLNETPATLVHLDRIVECDICNEYCNGFAYFYRMTQEHYCIHCSRLSQLNSVKHRGHRHAHGKRSRIFLAWGAGGSFCCSACGEQHGRTGMYITCVPCDFYLDMKCAALPIRVKPPDGKYDDHDLVLTSRPLPSDSYQSYCLVCEEERNPARWFYYCSLCDFSAHVECVVGKYPKVKFGGSHTFEHPHPLALVQFKEEKHRPPCHECESNHYDVGFRCTNSECDYIMCFTCSQDQE